MKEKTLACVRIEDMEARVFRALLHFIYTDSLPEMDDDDEDVDDVVAMAQALACRGR
jgi:speckle-type POZ protein